MTTIIELYGTIGEPYNTWQRVYAELLKDRTGDVEVRINSDGGDLQQALGIHAVLRGHQGTVTTRNVALAASAATIPMMAGKRRIVDVGSLTLVHASSVMLGGNAESLRKRAETLDAFDQSMIDIYASATGRDRDEVAEQVLAETLLTADEAVRYGYATELGESLAVAALWTSGPKPVASALIAQQSCMDIRQRLGLKADATDQQVDAALDALLAKQTPVSDQPPKVEATSPDKTEQPDIPTLVQQAVAEAFAAREAAAAVIAPAATQEELQASASAAAVERFIAEGKITPAQRSQAVQACGRTAASLAAAVAYWESSPRIVASAARTLGQPEAGQRVLSDLQKMLCEKAGMTPDQFLAKYNQGRN